MENNPISCSICFLEYKAGESPQIPFVLNCGHTFCHERFLQLKTCPICKEVNLSRQSNPHGLQGSANYALIELCKPNSKVEAKRIDSEEMKDAHFCLDCETIYKPLAFSFLSDPHHGHNTISLRGKDPELLGDFWWIKSNANLSIKENSPFCHFLRATLLLLEKMFTQIKIANQLREDYSGLSFQIMLNEVLIHGMDHRNLKLAKKGLEAYLSLKNLQQNLFPPMLLAIQDFGPKCIGELISPEISSLIQLDNCNLLMKKLQIPEVGSRKLGHMSNIILDMNESRVGFSDGESDSDGLGKRKRY